MQIDRFTNDADLIRQACDTSLRCYFDGVVSDIALRPTDSDDTVAWEIKAAQSMPEAAIGADKSRRKADKAETARNVIRAVVYLGESTPLMVPIPEGNRGPVLEMCARISRQLKWVGVGRHLFKYASGSVEFITSGKAPLLYGQIIDCPYLTEALLRCVSRSEMGDIRDLTGCPHGYATRVQRGRVGLGKDECAAA